VTGPEAIDPAVAAMAYVTLESPEDAASSGETATAAIRALEAVLAHTPEAPGDPLRAVILSNLGVLHLARFEHTSDASDLDTAVTVLSEAYRLQHRQKRFPALRATVPNLISALQARAEHTGNWGDLDAAISWGRAAVIHLPEEEPQRAVALAGLSSALLARYQRATTKRASDGDVTEHGDLSEAIDLGRQAAADLPESHSSAGAVLSTLGRALIAGGMNDEAVGVYRRARDRFRSLGQPHAEARTDNNLGGALVHGGRLDEAIAAYERALDRFRELGDTQGAARVEHNLAVAQSRAGEALVAVGRYSDALPYFEHALRTTERAMGPEHPDTAQRLIKVARVLDELGRHTEARSHLQRALRITERAPARGDSGTT
jgi:tetratricopeptide (TPR) repeat protein